MIIKQNVWASLALTTTLAGLSFVVAYRLIEILFGTGVPQLSLWQALVIGNINLYMLAISFSLVQRFTVQVIKKEVKKL